jgi:hypothetical protein
MEQQKSRTAQPEASDERQVEPAMPLAWAQTLTDAPVQQYHHRLSHPHLLLLARAQQPSERLDTADYQRPHHGRTNQNQPFPNLHQAQGRPLAHLPYHIPCNHATFRFKANTPGQAKPLRFAGDTPSQPQTEPPSHRNQTMFAYGKPLPRKIRVLREVLLVNLNAVDGQAGRRCHLLAAHLALEMLRFLMLYQHFFVVERSVAVVAERFALNAAFFLAHTGTSE